MNDNKKSQNTYQEERTLIDNEDSYSYKVSPSRKQTDSILIGHSKLTQGLNQLYLSSQHTLDNQLHSESQQLQSESLQNNHQQEKRKLLPKIMIDEKRSFKKLDIQTTSHHHSSVVNQQWFQANDEKFKRALKVYMGSQNKTPKIINGSESGLQSTEGLPFLSVASSSQIGNQLQSFKYEGEDYKQHVNDYTQVQNRKYTYSNLSFGYSKKQRNNLPSNLQIWTQENHHRVDQAKKDKNAVNNLNLDFNTMDSQEPISIKDKIKSTRSPIRQRQEDFKTFRKIKNEEFEQLINNVTKQISVRETDSKSTKIKSIHHQLKVSTRVLENNHCRYQSNVEGLSNNINNEESPTLNKIHIKINSRLNSKRDLQKSNQLQQKRPQCLSVNPSHKSLITHQMQTKSNMVDSILSVKAAYRPKKSRYDKLMNFDEKVMQCEFEKAERMLKRADKLAKKYKDMSLHEDFGISPIKKPHVQFQLPEI